MLRAAGFAVVLVFIAALAWANWPAARVAEGVKADLVVVRKSARVLELYAANSLLKSYAVSLGDDPIGPKRAEGDGRTPEGAYVLDYRKADSSFHRALHISYPSASDAAHAQASGVNDGAYSSSAPAANATGSQGYWIEQDFVVAETALFDNRSDRLLWTAKSETLEDTHSRRTSESIVRTVARQLFAMDLIARLEALDSSERTLQRG